MKTKIILLLLTFWAGVVWGQEHKIPPETIAKKYEDAIEATKKSYFKYEIKERDTIALIIHPKALTKNLSTIYQSIIPNNSSLNNNTNSFSYNLSDENQKIAIATAYQIGAYKTHFINVGISAEGKNGILNLYSKNSWNNNTSFSIGYSKVVSASQFYKLSPKKKDKIIERRNNFADSLSTSLQHTARIDQALLQKKLQEQKEILKNCRDEYAKSNNAEDKLLDEIAICEKKIAAYTKQLDAFDDLQEQVENNKVEKEVDDYFVAYDLKNDVLYGYNVFWLQINSKLMNNSYIFKEETNNENTITKNVFHANINGAIMWNWLGKKTMQYATFGISTFRGSYLSNPTFKGLTPVFNGGNIINNGEVLGTVDDLAKPVWQYSFNAYYANFFMFNKHLGLSGNIVYNNAFKNDIVNDYKENWSFSFGPIFKVQGEDDWTKATFGISGGFENLPTNSKAKDYFLLKAYVGVPFNVFIKK